MLIAATDDDIVYSGEVPRRRKRLCWETLLRSSLSSSTINHTVHWLVRIPVSSSSCCSLASDGIGCWKPSKRDQPCDRPRRSLVDVIKGWCSAGPDRTGGVSIDHYDRVAVRQVQVDMSYKLAI